MNSKKIPTASILDEHIREKAHQIWCDAGKPEGYANEHWFTAIQIILTQFGEENNNKKSPKKAQSRSKVEENSTSSDDIKGSRRVRSVAVNG
jgi:hypothetical protein